jgi:hypothetical protein
MNDPAAKNLGGLEFAHAEQSVYCRAREIGDMPRFVYRVSASVGAIWFLKKLAHPKPLSFVRPTDCRALLAVNLKLLLFLGAIR